MFNSKGARHKHDVHVDWVPTLQFGKKNYRTKLDHNVNAQKAERTCA